jgi:hypothetical protein
MAESQPRPGHRERGIHNLPEIFWRVDVPLIENTIDYDTSVKHVKTCFRSILTC